MPTLPYSRVSLQDSDLDPTEAQVVRDWMMADGPSFDEAPELEEPFTPDPEDEAWWSAETRTDAALRLLDFRHIAPGRSVALVENERPAGPEYRYLIIAYADGGQVDYVGKDTLGDAEAVFRHAARPLPAATAR